MIGGKNMLNIGFIKLLFPNAVIINCKRHPLDVVLSMFCTNFTEPTLPTSLDLIATQYKLYTEIMKHWHLVFPGQIYDNYYEEELEKKKKELK